MYTFLNNSWYGINFEETAEEPPCAGPEADPRPDLSRTELFTALRPDTSEGKRGKGDRKVITDYPNPQIPTHPVETEHECGGNDPEASAAWSVRRQ